MRFYATILPSVYKEDPSRRKAINLYRNSILSICEKSMTSLLKTPYVNKGFKTALIEKMLPHHTYEMGFWAGSPFIMLMRAYHYGIIPQQSKHKKHLLHITFSVNLSSYAAFLSMTPDIFTIFPAYVSPVKHARS